MIFNPIKIRTETTDDYAAVLELVEKTFRPEAFSNHKEHHLVERLRSSDAFIPKLSMLAEIDDFIIGYILLTKIKINSATQSFNALALAPVCVLPEYQGKGIGSALIEEAHTRAKELGYKSIALLGHKDYYPRFGYKKADNFKIKFPFNAPAENCMITELVENSLDGVTGEIEYPVEFFD